MWFYNPIIWLYIPIWMYFKDKKSVKLFRNLIVDGNVGVVILRLLCVLWDKADE